MRLRDLLLLCAFILCTLLLSAQQGDQEVRLDFRPICFAPDTAHSQDSISVTAFQIESFKCYISHLALTYNDQVVWSEKESVHLLDMQDSLSLSLALTTPQGLNYNGMSFAMGIDSLTSVSGAFGGDLDPTIGMYWTWNSGYIHFKLEGKHADSPVRNQAFEFHLGGYLPPYSTYQEIQLGCDGSGSHEIAIDLDSFLKSLDVREQYRIMSAGADAHRLSLIAAKIFTCIDAE